MSLTNYYDVTREGSIATWGRRMAYSVRETFDTEENAKKREADLLEAWRTNSLVMNDSVGLIKREYRDPGEGWKDGAGGIARHRLETREIKSKRTITVSFEIDAADYDNDEFSDHSPRAFIELAKAMLHGDADFPVDGATVTCDGVSEQFNQ